MVPRESSFTFGAMFDNYERDRELITEALLRPECRIVDGPIQLELRETCNADSFFRYAFLSELCHLHLEFDAKWWFDSRPIPGKSPSMYQFEMRSLDEQADDPAIRLSKLNELREIVLNDLWLASVCPADVAEGKLISIGLDPAHDELANWWNEGTDEVRRNQLAKAGFPHM